MATISTLEGDRNNSRHSCKPRGVRGMFGKNVSVKTVSLNPYILRKYGLMGTSGNVDVTLLGGSFWKKVGSVAKSAVKIAAAPVTIPYSATKSAAKATAKFVKKPSLKTAVNIVKAPTVRTVNATKATGKEVVHAVAESARATKEALDIARRMAKRAIKKLGRSLLFGSDLLGAGGIAKVPKNAAKAILMTPATAAVAASTVTAPAAPLVPVLINEVVDELYATMERNIKRGLSPEKAADEAAKDVLDAPEPGDENLPSDFPVVPIAIGVGLLGILLVIFKKRRG